MQPYETYESKTGYVREKATGNCVAVTSICLGKYSKAEDFEDITKEEYEAYVKEREAKHAETR